MKFLQNMYRRSALIFSGVRSLVISEMTILIYNTQGGGNSCQNTNESKGVSYPEFASVITSSIMNRSRIKLVVPIRILQLFFHHSMGVLYPTPTLHWKVRLMTGTRFKLVFNDSMT